jgi:hypothetical protein
MHSIKKPFNCNSISGHKSDTVAQQYIDQSTTMKRKASDVLSVGGGQVDETGLELRKKVATPAGKENMTPSQSSNATAQRTSGSKNIVVNVTFTGCNNVTYTNGN